MGAIPELPASVRIATVLDAGAIGQLLHDFNTEFDEPTPRPAHLAERIASLLSGGDTTVLVAGGGPDGVAILRFRAAIWSDALECYLAELYVTPAQRGRGLGRDLMQAAMDVARARGADHMDLGTSEDDVAARTLYESLGFINREKVDGPVAFFYQRELQKRHGRRIACEPSLERTGNAASARMASERPRVSGHLGSGGVLRPVPGATAVAAAG